jgi:hypothetical protein
MLYAMLMVLTLGALWASWRQHVISMPLFLLAMIATAWAFASDITDPLTLSL